MRIVGEELKDLILSICINVREEDIYPTALDVRIDNIIEVEKRPPFLTRLLRRWHLIDLRNKTVQIKMKRVTLPYILKPGEFIHAYTNVVFNIPEDTTMTYLLTSTPARNGLQHSLAIEGKPGWKGRLLLELSNTTQYHSILLTDNMIIGCMKFEKHNDVNKYSGQFNNQKLRSL